MKNNTYAHTHAHLPTHRTYSLHTDTRLTRHQHTRVEKFPPTICATAGFGFRIDVLRPAVSPRLRNQIKHFTKKMLLISMTLYIFQQNKLQISVPPFWVFNFFFQSKLCTAPRTNSSTAYRFLTRETLQRSFTESPPLTAQPQTQRALSLALGRRAHERYLHGLLQRHSAGSTKTKQTQSKKRRE